MLTASDSALSLTALNELVPLWRELPAHLEDAAIGINAGLDDSEFSGELLFKVEDGPRVGVVFLKVVQPAVKEVRELGQGRARFSDLLDQLDEIRRSERSEVVGSEPETRPFNTEIFENMQITLSREMDFHFAQIKEVQLSPEGALGAAGTLRDRFHDAALVCAPVHDHARLGKRGASNQCATCFQKRKFVFYL